MKVGFIGLGNMGEPVALNLLRAGYELVVYNRTRSRAEKLVREGAAVANSLAEVAAESEMLITMLADDNAVEEVVFGPRKAEDVEAQGILHVLGRGSIHISMSTISVALSRKLARSHDQRGQGYIAAPVFGRSQAAAAANLWIVAAGPSDRIEQCRPLFNAMGQGVFLVSEEPSAANVFKLAGNFMLAGLIEALGEAIAFIRKSGVDPRAFVETINTVLFKSPLYEKYGMLITEERYEPAGFKLGLGRKDIGLVLEAAEGVDVPLPLASLIRDRALSAVAKGQGEIDWAGLVRVSSEDAGLGR